MKIILIILTFLFLMCCKNEKVNHNNKVIDDKVKTDSLDFEIKDSISTDDEEHLYSNDPMFDSLFIIKFYDNYIKLDKDKDLTLVKNQVDTSIAFNFPLKKYRHSHKVDKHFDDNKSLFTKFNNINSRAFFLKDIKSLDENKYLGIFVEYFGFERILYCYGKLSIKDKNLNIENLYYALDRTGIGSLVYDQIIKVDNGDYFIVGNNRGEGHQSISLHYFQKDYRNKTYLIEKCNPSSEANPHDEKLEYNIDYKNKIITIEKFEMERDQESDWRKLSSNSYNILDLIEQLKK